MNDKRELVKALVELFLKYGIGLTSGCVDIIL